MGPKELHLYDFDGTLYRSPQPPNAAVSGTWYFHANSIGSPEPPGFDHRWVLPVLVQARRSSMDPRVANVVLTARPDHTAMKEKIYRTLALADMKWAQVQLKPVFFPGSDAAYKARAVVEMLRHLPDVRKVVFYDDLAENLEAVGYAVAATGRTYEPHLVRA